MGRLGLLAGVWGDTQVSDRYQACGRTIGNIDSVGSDEQGRGAKVLVERFLDEKRRRSDQVLPDHPVGLFFSPHRSILLLPSDIVPAHQVLYAHIGHATNGDGKHDGDGDHDDDGEP